MTVSYNRVWWPMLMLSGLLLLPVCAAQAAFPVYTYPPHSQQPIQVEGMDTPMGLSVAFDSSNRPYFTNDRTGVFADKLRTLRNGLWHDIDYSSTVTARTDRLRFLHSDIYIDGSNALYAVILTSADSRLLYSSDITASSPSFHSYRLASYSHIEKNMSHGDDSVPPAILAWPWISDGQRGKLRLYIPTKNSNGTLSLSDSLDLASAHAETPWAHSGGMPPVVSKNGKIHIAYLSEKNAMGTDSNSSHVWVATIDRATKNIDYHKHLSSTHGFGIDNHSMPVIGITSTDTVHVMVGTHGEKFPYYKATSTNTTSTLTNQNANVPNGNRAVTYVDLVIDDGDTLHTSYRSYSGPYLGVGYSRRPRSATAWENERILLAPDVEAQTNHAVPHQHLVMDRQSGKRNIYLTGQDEYTNQSLNPFQWFSGYPTPLIATTNRGSNWSLTTRYDLLSRINNGKTVQRITFPAIPNKYPNEVFHLNATTDASGLTVNYEVVSGPATLVDNKVTVGTGTGEVVIKAKNSGDATYYADEVTQRFQVDGTTIHNLAQGKPAYQSGTWQRQVASFAVDGNTGGTLAEGSATRMGSENWWEVDLGSVSHIDNIQIYNRSETTAAAWLSNYHVFISNVPFTGTSIAASQAQSGVASYHQTTQAGRPTTISSINRTGRYVRVQLTAANQHLSMGEVRVNGSFSAADTTPDAFAFTAQTGAEPGTSITSNAITLSGLNGATAIAASGGTLVVDGSDFTGTTVTNAQTVAVKVAASSAYNTATTATVTIGGVSANFSATTRPADITPDAFAFTAQTGVEPGATITSNAITLSGLEAATSIAVSGGTLVVDGNDFTGTTVTNGQTVAVKITASSSFNTAYIVTITIGGVSANFSATTRPADTTPGAFAFTAQIGVAPGATITSNTITLSGLEAATSIAVSGGTLVVDGNDFTGTTITNGQTVAVKITTSNAYSTTATATVTIGEVSADFSVTTRQRPVNTPPDTTPDAFVFTAQTGAEPGAASGVEPGIASGVEPGATITSRAITVSGLTEAASISVSGGTLVVDGRDFTGTTITNGQTVAVKVTASSAFSTTATAIVTIGGVSANFSVTTHASPGRLLGEITLATADGASVAFNPGTYTADVAHSVSHLTIATTATIVAITTPADADPATPGHQVNLGVGITTITFRATAEDGKTTRDYTVSVRRAPGQVTGVTITPMARALVVSWEEVPGADGYKVQWKSDAQAFDATRQITITGGTKTTATIPNLTAGIPYSVQVIATETDAGEGRASTRLTGTPKLAPPGQVTGVQVTAGIGLLHVSWTAVPGADGYKVQWKSGTQPYDPATRQAIVSDHNEGQADAPTYDLTTRQATVLVSPPTSHTIRALAADTQYTVRVIATRTHAADGTPSTEWTATPQAAPPHVSLTAHSPLNEGNLHRAPIDLLLTNTTFLETGLSDHFDLVTGVPGVWIDRLMLPTDTTATLTLAYNGRDFDVNQTLAVKVKAAGHAGRGDLTTGTVAVAAIVEAPPSPPTNVTATPGIGTLAVSWTAVPDADGYKVQWKSDAQPYDPATRQALVLDGTTTSHPIPELAAGTQYTVRVIATKAKAPDSPSSMEATGTPNALLHNTPNPFNPNTTIHYTIERGQPVRLAIYNMLGQVVESLVDGYQDAGVYHVRWEPRANLASGVYWVRLRLREDVQIRRILLVK